MIENDCPPDRLTLVTVTRSFETLSTPTLDVTKPSAAGSVDGRLQPLGTTNCTDPSTIPAAGAAKVQVRVRLVAPALTAASDGCMVPVPSRAARTTLSMRQP